MTAAIYIVALGYGGESHIFIYLLGILLWPSLRVVVLFGPSLVAIHMPPWSLVVLTNGTILAVLLGLFSCLLQILPKEKSK